MYPSFLDVLHLERNEWQELGAKPEILVWGGQVVMLVYYLRQTSTHKYKLIY